jgi:sodium/potassium-transporting ATPase subunit alpha
MDGIEKGRKILENFKKSICFILSSNIPLMMPFILSVFLPLPVHGSFLLYIAIISNTLLGAALLF